MVDTEHQYNPWPGVAAAWSSSDLLYEYAVNLKNEEIVVHGYKMLLPVSLGRVAPFPLYLDADTTLEVHIAQSGSIVKSGESVEAYKKVTEVLLSSMFIQRMSPGRLDFPLLFAPANISDLDLWSGEMRGSYPALDFDAKRDNTTWGIVRNQREYGKRYELNEQQSSSIGMLQCVKLGSRTDYLHPVQWSREVHKVKPVELDRRFCTIDRLPLRYAEFVRLVPSITHRIEIHLVATRLCKNLFAFVPSLEAVTILPAICTGQAQEGMSYERLELLGDTVLKFVTCLTLMADNPNMSEGGLTELKSRLVSNANLFAGAQRNGLLSFMLTQIFTGAKWKPAYNEELVSKPQVVPRRNIANKVVADICEALVGAVYLDSGLDESLHLLRLLVPEIDWQPVSIQLHKLVADVPVKDETATGLDDLQTLIDYSFRRPNLLVQAITHASYGNGLPVRSYERLEFLGDAILDYIVCTRLYQSSKTLSVPRMHLLKTAAVNSDFLAYRVLSCSATTTAQSDRVKVSGQGTNVKRDAAAAIIRDGERSLSDFMRFVSDPSLSAALASTRMRFEKLESSLRGAFSSDSSRYPWMLLATLAPQKIVSDLLESVLAAVYIDSAGDLVACERLLYRFGILSWLDDAIEREVHVWHSKEELGVLVAKKYNKVATYQTSQGPVKHGPGSSDGIVTCKIYIESDQFAEASGRTTFEAETKAAEFAIEKIQGERQRPLPEDQSNRIEPPSSFQLADSSRPKRTLINGNGHDEYDGTEGQVFEGRNPKRQAS